MAKQKKSSGRQISFKGVDSEIRKHTERAARVPEGDYLVKIIQGNWKENDDEEITGINWKTQIVKPAKYKGKTLYGYTHLGSESLWNLRNLIHAATGKNVAGKAVNLDLDTLTGKIVGVAVEDDEYKSKVRSRIQTWFPKDEFSESDDDEDEDDEDENDDEEETEDDDEDEDLDEVDVEDI